MKFAENTYLLSFLKKLNTILFGLLAVSLLSRTMGPTVKGEYDYYMNLITIFNVILNLGISSIYPNFKRKKKEWVFSTFFFISILQFFLYIIISFVTYYIVKDLKLLFLFLCLAISVLTIQLNNISLVEDYRINIIASIISVVVNAILAIIVFIGNYSNIIILLSIYIVKEATVSVIVIYSIYKKFSLILVNSDYIPNIIRAGFVPMLTNLLIMINYRIDVIYMKSFNIDFYQIGLYTAGLGIAEYAWIIPDIFKDVLVNKNARRDDISSVSFCIRLSSTFLMFAYLVLVFFGRHLLVILYGIDFIDSYNVTILVFLGVYSMVFCKLLGTLYLAQGKWNFYFYTLLLGVVFNLCSNYFLIPKFGILGAAFTTVLSYSIVGFLFLSSFRTEYNYEFKDLLFIKISDFKALLKI